MIFLNASTLVESLVALVIISIVTSLGLGSLASLKEADVSYKFQKFRSTYETFRANTIADTVIYDNDIIQTISKNKEFSDGINWLEMEENAYKSTFLLPK